MIAAGIGACHDRRGVHLETIASGDTLADLEASHQNDRNRCDPGHLVQDKYNSGRRELFRVPRIPTVRPLIRTNSPLTGKRCGPPRSRPYTPTSVRKRNVKAERRALALIFVIVAIPVSLTLWSVLATTRPDLYYQTPESDSQARGVDWPTLDGLASLPGDPRAARPELFGVPVRVIGYVVGGVGRNPLRFLLGPSPGTLFHPPHLDGGEVVDVTLPIGAPLPRGREAIALRGVLSADAPGNAPRGEAIFHLAATDVRVLVQ